MRDQDDHEANLHGHVYKKEPKQSCNRVVAESMVSSNSDGDKGLLADESIVIGVLSTAMSGYRFDRLGHGGVKGRVYLVM